MSQQHHVETEIKFCMYLIEELKKEFIALRCDKCDKISDKLNYL